MKTYRQRDGAMKKTLGSCMAVIALMSTASALAQESQGPRIEVKESRHDFGKVLSGAQVAHVFEVRNVGNQPLTIDRVDASCGCTAATVSSNHLEPGAVGQIKASVDTRGESGPLLKLISIHSNDSTNPVFSLSMTMEVVRK